MSANTNQGHNQSGFTLVELLVVMVVFSILFLAMMDATINYFASLTKNNAAINMTVQSQNFLRTTVERMRYSSGVRGSNQLSNTAVGGSTTSGYWTTSNSNFVVVIEVPALDTTTGNQIINSTTGDTYLNELVYYRNGNDLKLQILAANTGSDGTNNLRSTCQTAQPSCPADRRILENLDTISFIFYDKNIDVTPTPDEAKSVYISLKTVKDTFFGQVELDNAIRVTLRNNE